MGDGDQDLSFDFEETIERQDQERQRQLEVQGHSSAYVVSSTGRGRHSVVCKHWLKGMCMKGDACDFLHQYDLSRMPECPTFLKTGTCNDENCVFQHIKMEERKECVPFKYGFCKLGPLCRKRHDRLPQSQAPEKLPYWFLKMIIANPEAIPEDPEEKMEAYTQRQGRLNEARGADAEGILAPPMSYGRGDGGRMGPPGWRGGRIGREGGGGGRVPFINGPRPLFEQRVRPPVVSAAPAEAPERLPLLPPPEEGTFRCFIIKSHSLRNILTSVQRGIWASLPNNTNRFCDAYRQCDHVVLIFSANESGGFQGFGRMASLPDTSLYPGIWGDFSTRLAPNFHVQWLHQCQLSFERVSDLRNPWNEDKPLKKSRDGQELPRDLALRLCAALAAQPSVDLLENTEFANQPRIDHATFFNQPPPEPAALPQAEPPLPLPQAEPPAPSGGDQMTRPSPPPMAPSAPLPQAAPPRGPPILTPTPAAAAAHPSNGRYGGERPPWDGSRDQRGYDYDYGPGPPVPPPPPPPQYYHRGGGGYQGVGYYGPQRGRGYHPYGRGRGGVPYHHRGGYDAYGPPSGRPPPPPQEYYS
ncbi:unnamed protein product [Vitrella brassicaformis CCMP3155]|uniref:YTH domain-containing protein n=3 Tax=Vitrella brassicaformis TaxID=1169539 RepID=A0A0G4F398_VITBC|nr:unnamed protein product [Vitrella brassicaformis CCMP3155]|eukprot:CEM06401.1 unnamed protein product [Vitrella brassicaformis CCMP3155]